MTKEAYSVNEVLTALSIGRTTLYREMAAGRLKAKKIGKKTVFLAEDVRAYLDNLPVAA